jgi:cytochrome P450
MTDFETIDYYTDPSLVPDQISYFDHLRSKCPVAYLPEHDVFGITGYHEILAVFRDSEHFSSCNAVGGPIPGFAIDPRTSEDIDAFIDVHRGELPQSKYLVTLDPPAHKRQRELIMRLFTPKRMRQNEAYTVELAEQRVDQIIDQGKIEVLSDFSRPFAGLVIADLLGVPEEDRVAIVANLPGGPPSREVGGDGAPVVVDTLAFMQETFTDYIEDRRRTGRQDVLSELATATYSDGSLPETEELVRLSTFLFSAGQHTTAILIANALKIIGEEREVQDYLRADYGRIPNFIEEVLRYESVVKHTGRMPRKDVTIGGVEIPAGCPVSLFPGAANHDPRFFEAPHEFRPDRPNAKLHVSFGRGIHFCAGAPMARMEGRIAIECFLARTSDIKLDEAFHGPSDDRRYEFAPDYQMRMIKAVHIEMVPREAG